MNARGIGGNYTALESSYVQRLLTLVQSLGKTPIGWQEIFDNGLNLTPETLVHVWKNPFAAGQLELARATAAGKRVLLSSGLYLNYISYGPVWEDAYIVDPQNFTGTAAQKDLVMGGEFALWGEYIDATNLIGRGFPMGCAVGERLWSPAGIISLSDARVRLGGHTCRFIALGIPAEPPSGPSSCDVEWPFTYNPPF